MSKRMLTLLLAVCLLLPIGVVGCGDGSDDTSGSPTQQGRAPSNPGAVTGPENQDPASAPGGTSGTDEAPRYSSSSGRRRGNRRTSS